ncbi:MAG TPA: hypothetical protein VN699_20130, partial [Pirellulales bacterium]|nr:hypothetical protein [Pirellulales bacterium]
MKTTSRIFTAWTATGIILAAGTASAGAPSSSLSGLWGASIVGQAGGASVEDKKRAVADLLGSARKAMKEGRLETADSLVSRAEAMDVRYSKLHLGDTPKKARADLNRVLKSKGGVKLPSEKFQAVGPDGDGPMGADFNSSPSGAAKDEPRDPFAVRQENFEPTAKNAGRRGTGSSLDPRSSLAPPSEADQPRNLPTGQGFPDSSPFGKETVTVPPSEAEAGLPADQLPAKDAGRTQSDRWLLESRRALAVGDVRRASNLTAQAKQLGVRYDFHDDSPAKVEDAIERHTRLNAPGGLAKDSETYRRQQAESLLQQAEGLMNWGDFDEAQRLAGDAKRLNVNYGPFDVKPDAMLERVAAARRQGRAAGPARLESLPPVGRREAPLVEQSGPPAALDAATMARKQQAMKLVRQSRDAMNAGDFDRAKSLAEQAEELRVPDAAFVQGEDRPWMVLYQIQQSEKDRRGVVPAGGVAPIGAETERDGQFPGAQAMYDRNRDATENVPAGAQESAGAPESGMRLFQRGEEALRNRDIPGALKWFRQANQYRNELDPDVQQQLQEKLQLLSQSSAVRKPAERGLMNEALADQQLKSRRVSAELAQKEQAARNLQESDPKQALEMLKQARGVVEQTDLDSQTREVLLRRVNRDVEDLERFIDANRGKIELNERNTSTRNEIDRERKVKVEVQEKVALLVDEFNKLMDEHRWAEAEVVAKRAREVAPDEPVVKQIGLMVKMTSRTNDVADIRDAKEQGFYMATTNVDLAAVPFDDNKPYQFGPLKDWERLTKSRAELERMARKKGSEREQEIEQKLKTPVSLRFVEMPLTQVVEELSKLAQVNMYLDARGLAEEGVDTSTPVTIELGQDISLKSALNLILEPLHLSYVIKDEVLKITSEHLRDGEIYQHTYNVADLVTPIPNFSPNGRNWGLAGALRDAQSAIPMYGGMGGGDSPLQVVAGNNGPAGNAMLNSDLLAQMTSASGSAMSAAAAAQPSGLGPGGLGGGGTADFQSLIELITSTIAPTTWDEVGGPGAIQEYRNNLSLVISQTQEVHEEIADLLAQLRRLQDLQVTIEVRFITLNDNFFERIGVSFDFAIPTYAQKKFQIFGQKLSTAPIPSSGTTPAFPLNGQPVDIQARDLRKNEGVTVGLNPGGSFAPNLDIPIQQGSFGAATPQFGGFQTGAG